MPLVYADGCYRGFLSPHSTRCAAVQVAARMKAATVAVEQRSRFASMKIIWTCWFQGREAAPRLVESCLRSWEQNNPGWELRCLDATSIQRYVAIAEHVDLARQSITAASFSDILRILLLHEYGGVWVDATLFCNRPLDDWLPEVNGEGFFAFADPAPGRPLSSWFLSAAPGNYLVSVWCRHVVDYWSGRAASTDYFWFHHLFRDLCARDPAAAEAWSRVPRRSADGPHALQASALLYRDKEELLDLVDWTTPVFKLSYRLPEGALSFLLEPLLADGEHPQNESAKSAPDVPPFTSEGARPAHFASLKVSTENLGDHIQVISGLRLLSRVGVEPTRYIDRDDEIRSAPGVADQDGTTGILLNGWFKTNRAEWPPHPKLAPLIYSFHIRLFQCPELISEPSLDFFRRHQPIGCRDVFTQGLLQSNGVEAFTSNCISLTIPRRVERPETQTEVFVVSRDQRIEQYLPQVVRPYTFLSHYSGSKDFDTNMQRAETLLKTYASRAKLIVTTLLHCALPAVAMGIPVVVFYPLNTESGHRSDCERFSSLEQLLPIHSLDEIDEVNWEPKALDVSQTKYEILTRFYEMTARWNLPPGAAIGPLAPSTVLPPP